MTKSLGAVLVLGMMIAGVCLSLPARADTPDFKMAWDDPNNGMTVVEGDGVQKQFTLEAYGGFDGNVTVTVEDPSLITSVHTSLNLYKDTVSHQKVYQVSSSQTKRVTLTVWADNPTATGTFDIKVNGTAGNITHSLETTVYVKKKPETPAAKGFIPGFEGLATLTVLTTFCVYRRRLL